MHKIAFPVLALLLSSSVKADDITGNWQCDAKMTTVTKVQGRTVRSRDFTTGYYTFDAIGGYVANNPVSPFSVHGGYSLKSRKVRMDPNLDDLVKSALYGCSLTGGTCSILGLTVKSTGTVAKDLTQIKGQSTMTMKLLVNKSVIANAVSKGPFTCFRR
jgi:hypothetical protein